MKKVTLTIPADLEHALESYLAQHNQRLEDAVHHALREYLERRQLLILGGKAYSKPVSPIRFTPAEIGSDAGDISIHHDAYLAAFTAERKSDI